MIRCPACGGGNAPDAVFCANPACHKALGPFLYVREELAAGARWYERLAERAGAVISRPHFLLAHSLWFAFWVAANTGVVAFVGRFDEYPFNLLGVILAVEAIFITGFLLIRQERQSAHADKRAELDYEVNVRTYREIIEIDAMLREILGRLGGAGLAAGDPEGPSVLNAPPPDERSSRVYKEPDGPAAGGEDEATQGRARARIRSAFDLISTHQRLSFPA